MEQKLASAAEPLEFAKGGGLLPAIVQHADSGAVLMLGYMNRAALQATFARGRVTFFSRSRARLWEKGATSGHTLALVDVHTDCDRDALLVRARPQGPVCHRGTPGCFGIASTVACDFLGELAQVIAARLATAPADSYTAQLAAQGLKRVAQKVGEEAVETALAAAAGTEEELIDESADLLYHLLLLLELRGVPLTRVTAELARRHAAR
jgi:phosphoribosyl-ATP pyrophosphohydrolase/phosphoribosyl-AMP cyclohydrolase